VLGFVLDGCGRAIRVAKVVAAYVRECLAQIKTLAAGVWVPALSKAQGLGTPGLMVPVGSKAWATRRRCQWFLILRRASGT
jgi:hypothetical protein